MFESLLNAFRAPDIRRRILYVLGILGSLIGTALAALVGMGNGGGLLFALIGAVLLLILYRRIFQHRGITGPGTRRL